MKNILKNYRRRLLNLSTSNKALLLLRLSKELHLDVQELDFLNNTTAFANIQNLIAGKARTALCPYVDSRFTPSNTVSRRLRYISRRSEMIMEERGSQELYLGWPFVHGKFADGTLVRCPLLFFPIKLQVNGKQEWEMVQDNQQQPHFNQSFLLAYAHYTNTPVSEALMELDWNALPKEALAFRTQIYELLKENQLALNVGREFFSDRLVPFQDFKKKELEEIKKAGELYLEQECVIGVFPQAASFLLNDFDALLEQEGLEEMEDVFPSSDSDEQSSLAKQAQHSFTAFDLDASQEEVLLQVKQGKSVVVQGPPGTGKSQLICNLVSDFTARGKKVLVVSQKRVALDVVHQRLASKGLKEFSALVHDINADRKLIFSQLLHQIEHLEEYKMQNLALNSIQADRAFLEVCRGINRCTEQLQNFKTALFDAKQCGWSPKELYLISDPSEHHLQLAGLHKHFTFTEVAAFLPNLRLYLQRAQLFEQPGFPWKNRQSFENWGWSENQQLEKIIKKIPVVFKGLEETFVGLTGYPFSLHNLPAFQSDLPILAELDQLLLQEDVLPAYQRISKESASLHVLKKKLETLEAMYLVCPAPDAAIPSEQVELVEAAVLAFEEQQENLFKKIGWNFSANKRVLKKTLSKYNLNLSEQGVARLKERLELRKVAADLIQQINQEVTSSLLIEDYPAVMLEKVSVLKQALKVHELLRQLSKNGVLHKSLFEDVNLHNRLNGLGQNIKAAGEAYEIWLKWLPAEQIEQVLANSGYAEDLLASLEENFETLVAYDALNASLSTQQRELITMLLSAGVEGVEEGEKLFLNSIHLAWLRELEAKWPVLKIPSNGVIQHLESELQMLLQDKYKLSQEIVLSKLREQTFAHIEYNRLGNATTYRRLQVQVSKKRALYPIRKLFTQFQEEILTLVPCWLASPETVSAVLPLQECFDLVIFDEASQCFAEVGIPAIMRGKQVVVAGDEHQLKPSDLYRARWNPEDEEAEELTAESLLQLCSLYLPQVMLTQHYRSEFPELIEFSNQHFYKQKLELIPSWGNMHTKEPAIQFLQAQGVWQENVNLVEAEKVIKLVQEMMQEGQEEIGIITFNYKQQMLIQDMLEDAFMSEGKQVPASIIVKNIENIQGDEKDVIILSVGYAPDEKGRLTMQFGSLNQAGGENRLNVAITRARKQVMVVCSMEPAQLQVGNATHQGPALLKSYLQYAQQVSKGCFSYQPRSRHIPVQATLLKNKLQQDLPHLKEALPFADLTYKNQEVYESVVLTDDDLYYSQLSIRQSHADVPERLTLRSWPWKRVYSRQYWLDKEKVGSRLLVK